ncbi:MAG: restriction endonuclease subunit S, partial [Muribaculaceae bacterium]|nr:restriction endonuclease subunit S [Muribaculaceae bacterium]
MITKEFLNDGGTWEDYRLGTLFEIKGIKQAKSQNLIPKATSSQNSVNYIVQSTQNNMFKMVANKSWLIENNEPPVDGNALVLGVTLPAVSYQPDEFGASQVITARANFLDENIGLFFVSIMQKQMAQFSYTHKPGIEVYKNLNIPLPTKEGKIDFDFMRRYIATLKAERVATLKA